MQLNNTMLDFVSTNFLTQLIDKPTRKDEILDITLTTNPKPGDYLLPGNTPWNELSHMMWTYPLRGRRTLTGTFISTERWILKV